jgi:preprotein translocase subunit SecY
MITVFRNVLYYPDLRRRLIFTVLMVVIFRLIAQIPIITVDQEKLNQLLANNLMLGIVDLAAGGGVLTNFSIVAVGVLPYIMARTILVIFLSFTPLSQDGKRLERYSWLFSIPLALAFGWAISQFLDMQIGLFPNGVKLFSTETFLESLKIITAVTAGSMFSGWLAERITEYGLGKGPLIVILMGACLTLYGKGAEIVGSQTNPVNALMRLVVLILVSTTVVYIGVQLSEGERHVTVQYGKRVRERRIFGGGSTFIPIRMNPGGVQPALVASGLLTLVLIIAAWLREYSIGWFSGLGVGIAALFDPNSWVYWASLFGLIVLLTILYNDVLFDYDGIADGLQKTGGFIPGVRSGQRTRDYLRYVASRINVPGAIMVGLLMTLFPFILRQFDRQDYFAIILALLLCVNVVTDVVRQVQAQVTMRHYEGFIT